MKKILMTGAMAAACLPALAAAQATAPSPHSITGNLGLYSQYIFRGLTQTDRDPALQGGFDYSHAPSGLYLGTWGSNISWLRDFGAYTGGGSLELDFYGGIRGNIGKSDFSYDVGALYYWYPGDLAPGFRKADTLELYGALGWKWLSVKYSHSVKDETFGVADSRGTYYLDITASVPLGATGFAAVAHWGKQKFKGSAAPGVDNDSAASYEDWKLGLTYALPRDFMIGAFYTDTSMSAAQEAFYTTPAGRFIGKGTGTVFIQKTF